MIVYEFYYKHFAGEYRGAAKEVGEHAAATQCLWGGGMEAIRVRLEHIGVGVIILKREVKWILKIGPRKNKILNQFLFLIKYSPFSCRKMSFSRRYYFFMKNALIDKRINYIFRRNHPFSADCSFTSQIAFLTLKAILSQETLHSLKVILS